MDFYEVFEQVQRLPQPRRHSPRCMPDRRPQPPADGGTSSKRTTICTQRGSVARKQARKAARPQKMALMATGPLRVSRRAWRRATITERHLIIP